MNPKIAICIPGYCHGIYLDSLFQSILDQNYDNLVILVSDDASTDNSFEIMRKWQAVFAKRGFETKFTSQAKNLGPWGNCQFLASQLKELKDIDYIQFCESDDYFLPEKFHKQIEFLNKNPDFVAVHTDIISEYEDGRRQEGFWKISRASQTGGDPTIPQGFIRKYLEQCNFIYTCTMLVKADLYLKYYDYEKFLSLETGFGDWCFFLALSKEYKIGYLDENLSLYRVLSNSMSRRDRPWMVEKSNRIIQLARQGLI